MERLLFEKGVLKNFIKAVQARLTMNSEELAKHIGISGRTLRDWRREKFTPTKDAVLKLSQLSGIKVPKYNSLPKYWHIQKAAHMGGKRRFELYGALGTIKDRSKGGQVSWNRRKNNPSIWAKYTKAIRKPQESEDLAEFVGIMLGDGGLTQFQCTVYLNSDTDQKFAYYVRDLMKRLFALKPSIHKSKRYKVWRVSVSGVNLIKYLSLKGLSVGNKVHLQVGVPSWIRADIDYTKVCIRGLVDTDGCFHLHRYKVNGKEYCYPKLRFTNRSEPLLKFVYEGLRQLGFNPKKTFKYEVWLHNHNEVRRYLQEIGTSNYRPAVKKILEGGPDGKVAVC